MQLFSNKLLKSMMLIALGAFVIILCTLLAFKLPGSNIPQTAQTLGVLVVAAILGKNYGFSSVVLYLAVGLVGIPVFAEGTMGLEVFMGPTRGYLLGFLVAALLCGWWCNQSHNQFFISIFTIMILAHVLILAMGWIWLSSKIGPNEAFTQGVLPFFYGALIKSLIATLVVMFYFKSEKRIKMLFSTK